MNLTAPPSFPMENIIDCSSFVKDTYLPGVKGVLLWLVLVSFICDVWQIFITEQNELPDMFRWGTFGGMIFKAAILSVVLAFP